MPDQSPRDMPAPTATVSTTAAVPTDRARYHVWTPVTIRWCDTDKLGHVNNTAIAQYMEAGRCDLLYRLMSEASLTGIDFVLARIVVDFRRELHYPGTVEVGSRLTRLGTKSVTSTYGCFIGDTCYATAEAVNVFIDLETRKSIAPPPGLRTLLESYIAR
jgi:acyl-CoA thioester hydrolase